MIRGLPIILLAGCAYPGSLVAPDGATVLQTARYRVGIRDGAPELVVVLSNSQLGCGLPLLPDEEAQEHALDALMAAACREDAQHASVTLYRRDEGWEGTYAGRDDAAVSDLDAEQPRIARGAYFGVEEAFLVGLRGLTRAYSSAESVLLPHLGDGGEVVIDRDRGGLLTGRLDFPRDGVHAEFRAEVCPGDTSLLDLIATEPTISCNP